MAIGALFLILIINPFVVIGAGERGVVLNFGAVQDKVLGEGLHLRIPIMQKVVKMDIKVQKLETEAAAASADLQNTHSVIALNYRIDGEKASWIYQNISLMFKERIIEPAIQEAVKAGVAKFSAVDLITQRELVRDEIRNMLDERLKKYNILVTDFSIVNFEFSKEFSEAIEQKQTAEQLANKAQNDLKRIEIEAKQKITQARAEAEALRLQRSVITPQLVELRRIEAQMKAIEKWDGNMPQVTSSAVPFIGVGGNNK